MPIRVGMVSLGCSKNLVDSERMLFKLRKHGYTLVKEPGDADVCQHLWFYSVGKRRGN